MECMKASPRRVQSSPGGFHSRGSGNPAYDDWTPAGVTIWWKAMTSKSCPREKPVLTEMGAETGIKPNRYKNPLLYKRDHQSAKESQRIEKNF